MLRTHLIAVGRCHEPWRELAAEYEKRLHPYMRLTVHEVAEVRFRSVADRNRVITQEGYSLLAAVPTGSFVVALTDHGREFDSISFKNFLSHREASGEPLVFLIGGPLGLSPGALNAANRSMALSKLTFTHEMAQVILLEQLYRAERIRKGQVYHY